MIIINILKDTIINHIWLSYYLNQVIIAMEFPVRSICYKYYSLLNSGFINIIIY